MRGCLPLTHDQVLLVKGAISGRLAVRDRALFGLGVNTGFRVSEMLSLTVGDMLQRDGNLVERVTVARQNMKGKRESRTVVLNSAARAALLPWLEQLADRGYIHKHDPLFPSNRTKENIGRSQAWRIVHTACRHAGIYGRLGTHTMRKTFANNFYQDMLARRALGEPVDPFRATSRALDHKDIKSTDQYLSFLNTEIEASIERAGVW